MSNQEQRNQFVVTESAHWLNPDEQYLDTPDGTVCGIANTHEEAKGKILSILACTLYRSFSNYVTFTKDGAIIDIPSYFHGEWHIYEYDGSNGAFSLRA